MWFLVLHIIYGSLSQNDNSNNMFIIRNQLTLVSVDNSSKDRTMKQLNDEIKKLDDEMKRKEGKIL